jgi:hypothetical protein
MHLIEKLDEDLEQIASELGIKKVRPAEDLSQIYSSFSFTTEALSERRLCFSFQFNQRNRFGLVFGIAKLHEGDEVSIQGSLRDTFNRVFPQYNTWSSPWWAVIADYDDKYRNWTPDVFEAIRSGEFANDVKEKLLKLLVVVNDVCEFTSR